MKVTGIQNMGGHHSFGDKLHFAPLEIKEMTPELEAQIDAFLENNPAVEAMFESGQFKLIREKKEAPASAPDKKPEPPEPKSEAELAALLNK